MNFSLLAATLSAPNDLWTIIINWIQGAISNYGWTIILFTLLVKVATTPLDFMVKLTSKKQTLVQKKCAPEIAKLKKKFGKDQKTLQIQTNSLYKREGLKQGTGCIIMLVNLVLTMVIFFTLYSSLRNVSAYEAVKQYETLQTTYTTEVVNTLRAETEDASIVDEASANEWLKRLDENDPSYDATNYESNNAKATKAVKNGRDAVVKKWNEIKDSWLWVDSIWVADATTSPFPTYDALKSISGNKEIVNYIEKNINKDKYTTIASIIPNEGDRAYNGYYILAILVGLSTFASQIVGDLHNKLKNKKANTIAKLSEQNGGAAVSQPTMKVMKIVLPIVMVIFALTTAASFSIYMLASSVISLLLGELTTLAVDALTKKQRLEVEESLEKEANRLIRKGKIRE